MGEELGWEWIHVYEWFTWKHYNIVIDYTPVQIKRLKKNNCDFDSAIMHLIIIIDGLTHKEL